MTDDSMAGPSSSSADDKVSGIRALSYMFIMS